MKRYLLLSGGILSLMLGFAGLLLPLLPTTPLLLLSAACFIRSSDSLYKWLVSHPLFGAYLKGYLEHRAITLKAKVSALLLLWGSIGCSAIFATKILWVKLLLIVIAAGVTVHIHGLKTLTKNMSEKERRPE